MMILLVLLFIVFGVNLAITQYKTKHLEAELLKSKQIELKGWEAFRAIVTVYRAQSDKDIEALLKNVDKVVRDELVTKDIKVTSLASVGKPIATVEKLKLGPENFID